MAITIQTVNASDLIDAGRTKFNANDTAVAGGVTAVTDQLTAHVGAGHPDIYYTKGEVDTLVNSAVVDASMIYFTFGYDVTNNKVLFCGIQNALALLPGAGSIVSVVVTDTNGYLKEITANVGTYAVAQGDRLSVIAGADILPGDELNPTTGGILVNVSATISFQITALATGVPGFPGFGNFSIRVGVKLS